MLTALTTLQTVPVPAAPRWPDGHVLSLGTFLAQENNFGDTRTGSLAGPMGLLLILLLAIATVLLVRNMNARLRRLPDHFPDQPPAEGAVPRQGPADDDPPDPADRPG